MKKCSVKYGSGRHSRLMTDTLLTNILDQKPFKWGQGNLSAEGDVRETYIKALHSGDNLDYEPLKGFLRS